MKLKRISILILFILIGIIPFQNCSQTNFKASEEASSSVVTSGTPAPPGAVAFSPIPVVGDTTTTQTPIKLFLVVDFSPSMAGEIAKVQTALRTFLDNNRNTQAFDIYLFDILNGQSTISDPEVPNGYMQVLRTPIASFNMRPQDSNYETFRTQFFNSFENYRIAHQNDGDVTETGMCQILRLLHTSNLYSANSKVSFIMVTDENDSTNTGSCINKYKNNANPDRRALRVNYKHDQIQLVLNITARFNRPIDGGGTQLVTQSFTTYGYDYCKVGATPSYLTQFCGTSANNVQCPASVTSYINQNPSQFVTGTLISVNSCVINNIGLTNRELHLMEDTISQSPTPVTLEQIKNGASFRFTDSPQTTFANFQAWIEASISYATPTNISAGNIDNIAQGSSTVYTPYPELSGPGGTPSASAILSLINQKIDTAAGGKVAMDFVTYNSSDAVCTVQDTGINGLVYENFITAARVTDPTHYKRESICQSSYNSALLQTSQFINFAPRRSYTLTGQNAANAASITGVKIRTSTGVETILSANQYSLNLSTKVLSIPAAELLAGSTIILLP